MKFYGYINGSFRRKQVEILNDYGCDELIFENKDTHLSALKKILSDNTNSVIVICSLRLLDNSIENTGKIVNKIVSKNGVIRVIDIKDLSKKVSFDEMRVQSITVANVLEYVGSVLNI